MTIVKYKGSQVSINDDNYYNTSFINKSPGKALDVTKIVLPLAAFAAITVSLGIGASVYGIFNLGIPGTIAATATLIAGGGAIGNYMKPTKGLEEKYLNAIYDSARFTLDWYTGSSQNDDNDVNEIGNDQNTDYSDDL